MGRRILSLGHDLLARVSAAGGSVEELDGKIRLRAPEPLPDDLRAELREHKAEVLAALDGGKNPPIDPEVLRRAAMIREHLSKPGPSLFFEMPGATIQEGRCLTCGGSPPTGRLGVRCRVCCAAARLAIEG